MDTGLQDSMGDQFGLLISVSLVRCHYSQIHLQFQKYHYIIDRSFFHIRIESAVYYRSQAQYHYQFKKSKHVPIFHFEVH